MAAIADNKDGKRSYHNCVVLGCLNTTPTTEYTFFSLPLDGQRRDEWLRLIQREDLNARSSKHCRVCEVHFNAQCILVSPNRKVLKKNSVPTLFLPEKTQLNKSTQTFFFDDTPKVYSACTASQTPKYLMKELSLKKKPLIKNEKYGRSSRFQPAPADTERRRFLQLCDQFLTRPLAARVRDYTHHTPLETEQPHNYTQRALSTGSDTSSDELLVKDNMERQLNTDTDDSSDDEPLMKHVKRAPVSGADISPDEELVHLKREDSSIAEADPLRTDSEPSDERGSDNEQVPVFTPEVKTEIDESKAKTEVTLKRAQNRINVIKMEIAPEEEDDYDSED